MVYKTIVIDHLSKTKKMAKAIEDHTNKYALKGYKLLTFSFTKDNKAILLFYSDDMVNDSAKNENLLFDETPEAVGD